MSRWDHIIRTALARLVKTQAEDVLRAHQVMRNHLARKALNVDVAFQPNPMIIEEAVDLFTPKLINYSPPSVYGFGPREASTPSCFTQCHWCGGMRAFDKPNCPCCGGPGNG